MRRFVETFENLTGGMNRFDPDFRLKGHESPFLQNLTWHNGVLCSRWGQTKKHTLPKRGALLQEIAYVSCAPFLYHGWMLAQGSDNIYAVKLRQEGVPNEQTVGTCVRVMLGASDLPDSTGVFVRYREDVYFKAKGCYARLYWYETSDQILGGYVEGFIPTIQLNTDPDTGAGDLYQPENRLSHRKRVLYNAKRGVRVYHLPVTNLTSSMGLYVKVDGEFAKIKSVDLEAGTVTLEVAPPVHDPPVNNSVEIVYAKENPDAYCSLMDAAAIAVFGGAQDLCMVLGGPDGQPNAYFWSGNNGLVMDPTYFPMNQYNLAGDHSDPITAFGKQQNMLVIFQPNAIGRAVFGTEEINGRVQVTMDYTRINAQIGCDLRGSLQLVENNLVWCSRRFGVCRLKDSSAAYENNVEVISRKINGDSRKPGLLFELEDIPDDLVCSTDTGRKYLLVLGASAYEWNYELSGPQDPSWFYHRGIQGIGFVPEDNDRLHEVTASGVVAEFSPVLSDFGEAIEKICDLPARSFGTYDRQKTILSMIFTTRGDAAMNTQVIYTCDFGSRTDRTNLVVAESDGELQGSPFAAVFRRRPGYHNVRRLAVRLYNNTAGEDLSLVSAQIYYELRGRQR